MLLKIHLLSTLFVQVHTRARLLVGWEPRQYHTSLPSTRSHNTFPRPLPAAPRRPSPRRAGTQQCRARVLIIRRASNTTPADPPQCSPSRLQPFPFFFLLKTNCRSLGLSASLRCFALDSHSCRALCVPPETRTFLPSDNDRVERPCRLQTCRMSGVVTMRRIRLNVIPSNFRKNSALHRLKGRK